MPEVPDHSLCALLCVLAITCTRDTAYVVDAEYATLAHGARQAEVVAVSVTTATDVAMFQRGRELDPHLRRGVYAVA
jgi:hypothetical protein